jgi:uncharacterized lipoprotein YddW (UPF0748 family)
MKKTVLFLIALITFSAMQAQQKKREMRAVWIATVANIDWPSQRSLTSKAQREEMRRMLDEFAKNNINAIVMQIRPTADAFYPSALEPWSHWLTGKQGTKPTPITIPCNLLSTKHINAASKYMYG